MKILYQRNLGFLYFNAPIMTILSNANKNTEKRKKAGGDAHIAPYVLAVYC